MIKAFVYNNLSECIEGINKSDLCRYVGISRQYLYNLIDCKCQPTLPIAKSIALYICLHSNVFFNYSYAAMFNRIWLFVHDEYSYQADKHNLL